MGIRAALSFAFWILLLAVPVSAGAAGWAEDLAQEVATKGWIVYSAKTEKGDWDLFLMRPDGSHRRNLTHTPETSEAAARFSPDGKRLLYYRMPKAEVLDNNKYGLYELVISNADGSDPVSYGNDFPWASWSPDGKQISTLGRAGIQIVDVATRTVVRKLDRKGVVEQLFGSPDGKAFTGTANGLGEHWAIGKIDAMTGEIVRVSDGDCFNCTSDWFPDSRHIVYSKGHPKTEGWAQLWKADSEGKTRSMLYGEIGRHIYGGCISPDGQYALFTRSQEDLGVVENSKTTIGLLRLKDTPIIGGKSDVLWKLYPTAKKGPVLDLSAGWEPHWTLADVGARSDDPAGAETRAMIALFAFALAQADLAQEVHDKGWVVYGARSPKGDWDLFVMRPDGSDVRNLTQTSEFNEALPRYSPDGKRLLYRRLPKSETFDNNRHGLQGELVVASADGSNPETLGAPGEYAWASWSPDGKKIASLSAKGIVIVDLESRRMTGTLERKGFFQQMTWSPDGKWLSGVANSFDTGWSVARMEMATGAVNAVSKTDCCTPDWFPDSKALIFSRRPGDWTQLWMADAEGRQRTPLYSEDGRHCYGGCVSPDGKYVLFTGNKEEDGDPGNGGAPMSLMRLRDAPIVKHPAKPPSGPVLSLPVGWEPHWTPAKAGGGK